MNALQVDSTGTYIHCTNWILTRARFNELPVERENVQVYAYVLELEYYNRGLVQG